MPTLRANGRGHGIATVYDTLDALLADPAIEIVDIAVQPWHQRAIAEQALAAGKHLLCQKPLADCCWTRRFEAGNGGGKVAVNQQMRWSAGIAAAHDLIAKGYIGQPTDAQIQVTTNTPWHMWPWLAQSPRLEMLSQHSLSRRHAFLFGNPEWVTSRHSRYPLQGQRTRRNQDHHDPGLRRRAAQRRSPTHRAQHAGVRGRQRLQSERRLLRRLPFHRHRRGGSPARWAQCTTTRTAGPTRWSGAAGRHLSRQTIRGEARRQVDPRFVYRPHRAR